MCQANFAAESHSKKCNVSKKKFSKSLKNFRKSKIFQCKTFAYFSATSASHLVLRHNDRIFPPEDSREHSPPNDKSRRDDRTSLRRDSDFQERWWTGHLIIGADVIASGHSLMKRWPARLCLVVGGTKQ